MTSQTLSDTVMSLLDFTMSEPCSNDSKYLKISITMLPTVKGLQALRKPQSLSASPSLVSGLYELYRQRATQFTFNSSSILALSVIELISSFLGAFITGLLHTKETDLDVVREEILVP
jgi:hypothetical protein